MQINDGILLLENIGGRHYRVERMFWQLKHAAFSTGNVRSFEGAFTDCRPGWHAILPLPRRSNALREIAPCPVLTGFPFGPIPAKVTLPMGRSQIAIGGPTIYA